ncbi:MAG TPA: hypothetical protein VN228_15470 [Pyrinomonadaceae bacterium]|nr:hypothetical protein [Pyrinomonadaceae bacterium]
MPKWALFGLAAVGDFVVAALVAYYSGRVVIPAVLAVAGLFMLIAAVGSAMGRK